VVGAAAKVGDALVVQVKGNHESHVTEGCIFLIAAGCRGAAWLWFVAFSIKKIYEN